MAEKPPEELRPEYAAAQSQNWLQQTMQKWKRGAKRELVDIYTDNHLLQAVGAIGGSYIEALDRTQGALIAGQRISLRWLKGESTADMLTPWEILAGRDLRDVSTEDIAAYYKAKENYELSTPYEKIGKEEPEPPGEPITERGGNDGIPGQRELLAEAFSPETMQAMQETPFSIAGKELSVGTFEDMLLGTEYEAQALDGTRDRAVNVEQVVRFGMTMVNDFFLPFAFVGKGGSGVRNVRTYLVDDDLAKTATSTINRAADAVVADVEKGIRELKMPNPLTQKKTTQAALDQAGGDISKVESVNWTRPEVDTIMDSLVQRVDDGVLKLDDLYQMSAAKVRSLDMDDPEDMRILHTIADKVERVTGGDIGDIPDQHGWKDALTAIRGNSGVGQYLRDLDDAIVRIRDKPTWKSILEENGRGERDPFRAFDIQGLRRFRVSDEFHGGSKVERPIMMTDDGQVLYYNYASREPGFDQDVTAEALREMRRTMGIRGAPSDQRSFPIYSRIIAPDEEGKREIVEYTFDLEMQARLGSPFNREHHLDRIQDFILSKGVQNQAMVRQRSVDVVNAGRRAADDAEIRLYQQFGVDAPAATNEIARRKEILRKGRSRIAGQMSSESSNIRTKIRKIRNKANEEAKTKKIQELEAANYDTAFIVRVGHPNPSVQEARKTHDLTITKGDITRMLSGDIDLRDLVNFKAPVRAVQRIENELTAEITYRMPRGKQTARVVSRRKEQEMQRIGDLIQKDPEEVSRRLREIGRGLKARRKGRGSEEVERTLEYLRSLDLDMDNYDMQTLRRYLQLKLDALEEGTGSESRRVLRRIEKIPDTAFISRGADPYPNFDELIKNVDEGMEPVSLRIGGDQENWVQGRSTKSLTNAEDDIADGLEKTLAKHEYEDIHGVEYFRNPQEVLGGPVGIYQILAGAEFGQYKTRAAIATLLKRHLKDVKKGSKKSDRIGRILLGKATDADGNPLVVTQEDARDAAVIKQVMDGLAGLAGISRRDNVRDYFGVLLQRASGKNARVSPALLDVQINRGNAFYSHMMTPKKGRRSEPTYDVVEAFRLFERSATEEIFMEPALKQARERADEIGLSGNRRRYFNALTDRIRGKPTKFSVAVDEAAIKALETVHMDKALEAMGINFHNPATRLAMGTTRMFYRSLLGGSIGFFIKNSMQLLNTGADAGALNTLRGFARMMSREGREYVRDQQITRDFNNMFEDARFFQPEVDTARPAGVRGRIQTAASGVMRTVDDVLFAPVHFSEFMNRGVSFHAGVYNEAQRLGIKDPMALLSKTDELTDLETEQVLRMIAAGHTVAQRTQFVYSTLGRSPAFQTNRGRMGGQFLTYSINQAEFISDNARNNPTALIRMIGLTGYFSARLSDIGVDPTGFLGFGFLPNTVEPGVPVISTPMISATYNILRFLAAAGTNNPAQKEIWAGRIQEDIKHMLVPGSLQGQRITNFVREYETYRVDDPSNRRLIRKVTDREKFIRLFGLPTTEQKLSREMMRDVRAMQNKEQFQRNYIVNEILNLREEYMEMNDQLEKEGSEVRVSMSNDDYYNKLISQARAWGLQISRQSVKNAILRRELTPYLRSVLKNKKDAIETYNRYLEAVPQEAQELRLEPIER